MATISNTVTNPSGQTVAALFAGKFSDSDAGNTLGGIAIVANNASAGTDGQWQYSSDGGAHWYNVGAPTAAAALMVSASTLIRFLRASGFDGYPGHLSVRAVDSTWSGGFSVSDATETRVTGNAAAGGGSSPIAADDRTVSGLITGTRGFDGGGNATSWTDAANWTDDRLPTEGTIVSLSSGSVTLDNDSTNTVYQLLLTGTATLTIHDISPKTILQTTLGGSAASGTTIALYSNGYLQTDGVFGLQGALNAGSGGTVGGLIGPGTFINSGTVSVASGGTLAVSSGATFQHNTGGTYAGTGSVTFADGTILRLTAGMALPAGSSWQIGSGASGAGITKSGAFTLTNNGTLRLVAATVAPDVINASGATLLVQDPQGTVSLSGTLNNAGSLLLSDTESPGSPSQFTVAGLLTNSGGMVMSTTGSDDVFTLDVTGAGLVNTSTGLINIANTGGTTFGHSILGQITNQGTISVALTNNRLAGFIIGTHDSTNEAGASFTVTAGSAVISGTGSQFTNRGTISVSSGATFKVSGSTTLVQDSGSYAGIGTILIDNGASLFTNSNFVISSGLRLELGSDSKAASAADFGRQSGTNTLINQGTLAVLKSTVAPRVWNMNGGTVEIKDTTADVFTGEVVNYSGGAILVSDTAGGFNTEALFTGAFTNQGAITLTGSTSDAVALTVSGHALINDSTGQITIANAGGTSFTRTVNAQLTNAGVVTVNLTNSRVATFNIGSSNSANNAGGQFNVVAGGATITGSSGAAFVNAGVIAVSAGAKLTIAPDVTLGLASGGTLTGAGTIFLDDDSTLYLSTNLSIGAGLTLQLGTAGGEGVEVQNAGSYIITNAGTLDLRQSEIGADITNSSGGSIIQNSDGGSAIGAVDNQSGATLTVQDTSAGIDTTLVVEGSIDNHGSIILTGSTDDLVTLDAGNDDITNFAGATLTLSKTGGTSGQILLVGVLVNHGQLNVNLVNNQTATLHLEDDGSNGSSGQITVTAGVLDITGQNASGVTFSNISAMSVAAGAEIKISGGLTFVHGAGGTYTGAGKLFFDNDTTLHLTSNLTLGSSFNMAFGTSAGTGASVTRSGVQSISNNGVLDLKKVTFAPDITNNTGAAIQTLDSYGSIVTGAVTNLSGASLTISDTVNDGADTQLSISGGFSNSGTVLLTSNASDDHVSLDLSGGAFTNNAGGTLNFTNTGGTSSVRHIYAQLANSGTINVNLSASNQAIIHTGATGSLNTASGAMILTNGTLKIMGTSGATLTNSGAISVAGGAVLNLTDQTLVHAAGGTYTGSGNIYLDAGGAMQFGAAAATVAPSLTVSGGGNFQIKDSNDVVTLAGAVAIQNGGIFSLIGSNGSTTELNVTNSLTNAGLIQLTSQTSSSAVTLDAAGQTLTNSGTLNIDAGVGGARGIAGHIVNATGGAVNVNASSAITIGTTDFDNSGTITVAGGQTLSVTGSGAARLNNLTGGTLTVTGTLNLNGRDLYNAGTINGFANINFGGGVYIVGNTANVGGTVIGSGQTIGLGAGGTFTGPGTLTIQDGGTFRVYGNGTTAANLTVTLGSGASGATWSSVGGAVVTVAGVANVKSGTVSTDLSIASGGFVLAENLNGALVTLSGTTTVQTGGTILIRDTDNTGGNTTLSVTGTVNNSGTVNLVTTSNFEGEELILTGGTFNNLAGGTLTFGAGNGQGARLLTIGANALNNNGGTFQVDMNGTVQGGTFSNAGLINIAGGKTLTIASGATLVQATGGTYGGSGLLFLDNGSTFRIDAAGTLVAGLTLQLGTTAGVGASWSNTGGATATVAGTVDLRKGTVSSNISVANGGLVKAVNLNGSVVTLSGTTTVQSGGNIHLEDTDNTGGNTTLSITGTLNNSGSVDLVTTSNFEGEELILTGGTFNNLAGGTLTFGAGNGQGARLLTIGANAFNNNGGTFQADFSGTVQGGTFSNAGLINIAGGKTLTIASGATLVQATGGTYGGSGLLFLDNGSTFRIDAAGTLVAGLTLQLGTTAGAGANWSNTGGATATVAGTVDLRKGTVSSNISVANGGLVKAVNLNGSVVTLSGTTTVQSGGNIHLEDTDNTGGNTTLSITGTLNNSGSVDLVTTSNFEGEELILTGGTFNNLAGGTLTFGAGNGQGARLLTIGANAFNNNGGTFQVDFTGTVQGGNFVNAGLINIASGKTLTIASGSMLVQATGAYTGAGTLLISNGATFRFNTDGTIASGLTVQFGQGGANAVWDNTSASTATIAGAVDLVKGTISANISVASGGIIRATNLNGLINTFSGTLTLQTGGTLLIQDSDNTGGDTSVFATGTVNNSGTITLITTSNFEGEVLNLTGGGLNNLSGGILDLATGNGQGGRTVIGAITNAGNINVHHSTIFTIGANNLETLSGGTFTIDSGKTATITAGGAGIFMVDIGATLTVNGTLNLNGHDLYGGGTITNFANINFGGGTYILGGSQTLGGQTIASGNTLAIGGGTFSGPGTLTIADGGTFKTYGAGVIASNLTVLLGTVGNSTATWSNVGGASATLQGIAELKGGVVSTNLAVASGGLVRAEETNGWATLSGTVDIQSGGTLEVLDSSNNGNNAALTVTGTVNNTGTILVDGSGPNAATLATSGGGIVVNLAGGVINIDNGAYIRVLQGNIDNRSGATINVTSSYGHLAGSGLSNAGTVDIAAGRTLTIDAGATLTSKAGAVYSGADRNTSTLYFDNNSNFALQGNGTFGAGLHLTVGTTGGSGSTWTQSGGAIATIAGYAELHTGSIAAPLAVASGGLVIAYETGASGLTVTSIAVQSGGELDVRDVSNNGTDTQLNIGVIDNAGIVEVATGGPNNTVLNVTGTLTNQSGGVLRTENVGGGGNMFIFGTVNSNAGAATHINNSVQYQGGVFTNAGAFDFANAAVFTIGSGANLTHTGAGIHYAGTGGISINGGGVFQFNANGTLESGVTLTLGAVNSSNGTLTVTSGAATIAGQAYFQRGSFSGDIVIAGTGVVDARETGGNLSGSGTITVQSGGMLRVHDDSNNGLDSSLAYTGTINNSGFVVLLTDPGAPNYSILDLSGGGVLNNLAGGVLRSAAGNGVRVLYGTVNSNSGASIEINYDTLYQGNLNNAGAFSFANGAKLTVGSGGTLTHSGAGTTYTGSGTLYISGGGAFQMSTAGTIAAGTVMEFGANGGAAATWSGAGGAIVAGTAVLRKGTVSTNLNIVSGGLVNVNESGSGVGLTIASGATVTVASGGTFQVYDDSNNGTDSSVSVGGVINNSGIVRIGGSSPNSDVLNMTGSGALNNLAGGTLVFDGSVGVRYLLGTVNNANLGTISVTADGKYQGSATLSNSGALTVASGAVFTIDSGATFANTASTATYTGAGLIYVAPGGTFTASADMTIASGATIQLGSAGGNAAFTKTGTPTITVQGRLDLYRVSVAPTPNVTVASGGRLTVTETAGLTTLSGVTTIASGGELVVTDISNNGVDTGLTITGTLNNAGTARMNVNGGVNHVVLDVSAGTFNNTGTFLIEDGAGVRSLAGGINTSGSVGVDYSGVSWNLGAANIDILSGGSFTINSGKSVVLGAGGAGQFKVETGATLNVNGSLNLNGHDLFAGGTINGLGNIAFNGGFYILTSAFNAGGYTVSSGSNIGLGAGSSLTGTGTWLIDAGATVRADIDVATPSTVLVQLGQYGAAAAVTTTGNRTVTLNGGMDARRGTISANIINASGSTITAYGTDNVVTFSGAVTNQTGGTIHLEAVLGSSSTEVNFTGALNNAGSVILTASGGGGGGTTLDATGGAINNNSGGVFNVNAGGGGTRTLVGTLNNNTGATVNVNQDTTYQGGTFTNQGALAIAASKILTVASGATVTQGAGGTYTGGGTLYLSGGATLTIGAAASLAPKLDLNNARGGNAVVNGAGTLTLTGGATLGQGTISANVTNASGSTITAYSTDNIVTFSGTVTNQTGGTIQLEAALGSSSTEVNFTGTLNNAGSVILTASGGGGGGTTLDAAGSTVNNSAGGVFSINAGGGGTRTVNGDFNNGGTVNLNTGAVFNIAGTDLDNLSGAAFNVLAGSSTVTGTGTSKFNNASVLQVASGATLSIAGTTTLTQQTGGTITGGGTLLIGGGAAFNVGVTTSLAPKLQLSTNGGSAATVSGAGSLTLTNGADLNVGTISANVTNASGSTITAYGTDNVVTLSGTVTNQTGGTIQLEAALGSSSTEVNFTGTLNNAGNIILTASGGGGGGTTLDATGGAINNNSGGVFSINAGGGTRTLVGTLNNNTGATVNVNQDTTYQGGTFTNQGALAIAASKILTVASGATVTQGAGGTYTGGGTLYLSGGATLTIGAAASLAPKLDLNNARGSNAVVNGAGTLTLTGGATLGQGTISANVTNASGSTITAYSTDNIVTFSGTVTNQTGGTIQLEAALGSSSTEVNFTGTLNNAGSVILTASGGGGGGTTLDATGGTINNNSGGVFSINAGGGGTRTVNGGISNAGTITLNASTTLNIGSIDLDNQGTFTVAAGTTNIVDDDANARQFHNFSGATLTVSSGATLNMNGTDLLNDGTIGGTGTISMGSNGGNPGTFTNNGSSSITPGASPGHLTIDGNAVFGGLSSTVIEIGGRDPAQVDLLTVTHHFTMGGTLSVVDYHGFAAQAGDAFHVLDYAAADGIFDQAVGLDSFGPVALDPIFTATDLTLVARSITAEGTDGSDILTGTSAGDVLVGRGGGDTLIGGAGDDLLLAGEGTNTLIGGQGNDRLIGGTGIDTADYSGDPAGVTVDLSKGFALDGWGGKDTIIGVENVIGTAFADTIVGNAKDNVLVAGGGADTLTGGAGADTFVLGSPNAVAASITDFMSGQDKIQVDLSGFNFGTTVQSGANFSVISSKFDGSLAGANAAFNAGHGALIYSEADSTLYFDANGGQDGYSVVAHFQTGAHVVASDIRVVDHLMA